MIECRTIKELCSVVVDCPHSTPTWTAEGKIVVRNNNIKNGRIDFSSPSYTDDEHYQQRIKRANLKSKKQNIAQVVEGQFWVNNHAHIVQGNELCNTRYLCYLLNSMDLSGYVTGSAQPKLSQANLNAVTLFLPSITVQERIVESLYLFDKKIAVNQKINDNLAA